MTEHRYRARTARLDAAAILVLVALCAFPSHALAHGWVRTGSLASRLWEHTATLLLDGKVLVAGGYDGSPTPLASAQLYDPETRTFGATGSMTEPRRYHNATPLPDGRVLVTGGINAPAMLSSAEIYDPATGTWSSTGSMQRERAWHAATLLQNGRVLVTGGTQLDCTAELFDPDTGTFTITGLMTEPRYGHLATLLPDGRVLVTGGKKVGDVYLSSAELYDPETGTFAATGSMTTVRSRHTATLLQNGKVFVTGGENGNSYLSSAELYDPDTGTWSSTGSMHIGRISHSATLLENGKVLVAGGRQDENPYDPTVLSSAELYDPETGAFAETSAMTTQREYHTATLLQNGEVLAAGGDSSTGTVSSAEVYDSRGVSPPAVASTDPAGAATDISTGPTITVVFDEPMDPASITAAAFTLVGGGGTIACTATYSGGQATFTPSSGLAGKTTYTATVKASVTNVAGTPMAADYSWTFTTVAVEPPDKQGFAYVRQTFGCAVVGPDARDRGIGGVANALVLLIPAIAVLLRRRT